MIIVHAHSESLPNTRETELFFQQVRNEKGYMVYDAYCPPGEPFSYYYHLNNIWAMDDLVIIEGDVVPTLKLLDLFHNCPHRNCAAPVELCSQRAVKMPNLFNFEWQEWDNTRMRRIVPAPAGSTEVSYAGLACIKISYWEQVRIKDMFRKKPNKWQDLDFYLITMMRGYFHIHYEEPVKHNCCKVDHPECFK